MIRFTVLTTAEKLERGGRVIRDKLACKALNSSLEVVQQYDKITFWTRHPVEIETDIDTFHQSLASLSELSKSTVVHGKPCGNIPLDQETQRLKYPKGTCEATLADQDSPFLVIDVDAIDVGVPLDGSPALQAEVVIDLLGPEFAGVSVVWQLSASAKPGATTFRGRLWFITDEPLNELKRQQIGKAINQRSGLKLFDTSIYTINQPIYTAAPVIEGGDPIPNRWGVIYGESDKLKVAPLLALQQTSVTSEYTGAGQVIRRSLQDVLDSIGDHSGGGGFHEPIRTFVMRAVGMGLAPEAIKHAVRAAVARADSCRHTAAYISNAVSDRELNRSIAGASLRVKHNLPERETRQHTDELPLPVAERQLRRVVNEFIKSEQPVHTVVKITVGVGKTFETARIVRDCLRPGQNIAWFAKTIEQGAEAEGVLNNWRSPLALQIRGRLHTDDAHPEPPCQRAEEIQAAQALGVKTGIKSLFCFSEFEDERGGACVERCPFWNECAYFRQFTDPRPVRILSHEYLTLDTASVFSHSRGRWYKDVDRIIIDESPVNTLIKSHKSIAVDDIIAVGGKLPKLAQAVVELSKGEACTVSVSELVAERAKNCEQTSPPIIPSQTSGGIRASLETFKPNPLSRFSGLYAAIKRYLEGDVNLLWFNEVDGKRRVFFTGRKRSKILAKKPALILDATADETIYRALLGDDIRFVEINVRQNIDIVQVTDAQCGKARLTDEADLLPAAVFLARSQNAALITHKDAIKKGRELGWIPDSMPTGWFNNLRGMNRLEAIDALVIAGRIEPHAVAVEATARALWPSESLRLDGRYQRQRHDGAIVNGHADGRVDAVLRQYREAELAQAIGRLRGVRSKITKRVFIMTNAPVELPNVQQVALDDLIPDKRLMNVMLADNGVAILNPRYLAAKHGTLFKTENEADCWLKRLRGRGGTEHAKGGRSPYMNNITIRETTPFSFRVAGQKGSDAKALSWNPPPHTRATLERLLGRSVTKLDQPDTPAMPTTISCVHVINTQYGDIEITPTLPPAAQVRLELARLGLPIPTVTRSEAQALERGRTADLANFICRAIQHSASKRLSFAETLRRAVAPVHAV